MDPRDVRRWARTRREASERELAELVAPTPDVSVRAALDLLDVVGELHGWPPRESAVERKEDERAWRTWARLRKRLRPA